MGEHIEEKYISMKAYRDIKNSVDTAKREGEAIGLEKGKAIGLEKGVLQEKQQTVIRMLQLGFTVEQIAQSTNLTVEEIKDMIG